MAINSGVLGTGFGFSLLLTFFFFRNDMTQRRIFFIFSFFCINYYFPSCLLLRGHGYHLCVYDSSLFDFFHLNRHHLHHLHLFCASASFLFCTFGIVSVLASSSFVSYR